MVSQQAAEAFREATAPLLRPSQVQELSDEIGHLEGMLRADPYIRDQIQQPRKMRRRLKRLRQAFDTQAPKPYEESERDKAVAREAELREHMVGDGMPTQAEMRRRPAGAPDKHIAWEKRNKARLLEWKNIRLRMHASGMLPDGEEHEVANFERHRPVGGAAEMNLDNTLITPASRYLPQPGADPAVVFDDDDLQAIGEMDPRLRSRLALMTADQRSVVRAALDAALATIESTKPAEPKAEKAKETAAK